MQQIKHELNYTGKLFFPSGKMTAYDTYLTVSFNSGLAYDICYLDFSEFICKGKKVIFSYVSEPKKKTKVKIDKADVDKAVALCNHITQAISALPSKKVTSTDRSTEGKKLLCSAECMGKKADFYENYVNLGGEIIFYFDIERIFFDQESLDLDTDETRPAITILKTDGTSEEYLVSQSGTGNVKAAIKIVRPIVQDMKFKL